MKNSMTVLRIFIFYNLTNLLAAHRNYIVKKGSPNKTSNYHYSKIEDPKITPQKKSISSYHLAETYKPDKIHVDKSYQFSLRDGFVEFPDWSFETKIWIDVPNDFPWRKCLYEYVSIIITIDCIHDPEPIKNKNLLYLRPLEKDSTKFHLMHTLGNQNLTRKCVEPNRVNDVKVLRSCSSTGFWRWNLAGLLVWKDWEGCLSSTGGNKWTILVPCDPKQDSQIVEIGEIVDFGINKLQPFNGKFYAERAWDRRNHELTDSKSEINVVLEEIINLEIEGDFLKSEGQRRAVVFYVDKGTGFLKYLTWWMFAWKEIGLNSEQSAFDIILMSHPKSIRHLPEECTRVDDNFNADFKGPGRCLFKELLPLSERDYRFDGYMNSQECLYHPSASFLLTYKVLLRADLDTFPTPGMLDLWPTRDVICFTGAVTLHNLQSIKDAIVSAAQDAGITHHGWHNTDSAWMGPARKIVSLAKLTTVLSRFTRAHMFGPNTLCRCPTCFGLIEECSWGQGIYAGTHLLYVQEIALNRMWTRREFEANSAVILDASTTDVSQNICEVALCHARHNADPFSKFKFLQGEYEDWDMSRLDLTNVRDYAMYMAVASSSQGRYTGQAMKNFYLKENSTSFEKLCDGPSYTSPWKKLNTTLL